MTFTHTSGVTAVATPTAVTTLDSATGLRRLTLKVPSGLPVGTTALRVLNKVSGEASTGKSIEVIEISMPDVSSAAAGTSNLNVRITGSPNCKFVAGATRATFGTGSGITVNSTTVESSTSLVANITVSATAVPGLRSAGVITTTQTAFRADVFTITNPGPWLMLCAECFLEQYPHPPGDDCSNEVYSNWEYGYITGLVDESAVSIAINGVLLPPGEMVYDTGPVYFGAWETDFFWVVVTLPMVDGPYPFTVVATDSEGNQSSATVTFILDMVLPNIVITGPPYGAYLNTPTATIQGTVDDPEARVWIIPAEV